MYSTTVVWIGPVVTMAILGLVILLVVAYCVAYFQIKSDIVDQDALVWNQIQFVWAMMEFSITALIGSLMVISILGLVFLPVITYWVAYYQLRRPTKKEKMYVHDEILFVWKVSKKSVLGYSILAWSPMFGIISSLVILPILSLTGTIWYQNNTELGSC